jgi:ribosomal protein S18 acetylase RimI-like enzyme
MNVRPGTPADVPAVKAMVEECTREIWQRPFPPFELPDDYAGQVLLLAEIDGVIAGCTFGFVHPGGPAHMHFLYVRPPDRRRGVAKELMRAFAQAAADEGTEHLTLDVDTTNDVAHEAWRSLGFTEWALRMSAPIDELEARLSRVRGESSGRVYVQTDDVAAIERAVAQFMPRLGRSERSVVHPPANGWTCVEDELCSRDPKLLRRLAQELSYRTGGVVLSLGIEDGAVVRYILFERGSIADEYASVPEYFGPLPPGDVVALGANPTVAERLTGADPARVRAIARTAASSSELPPPEELLAQLAELLGVG